MNNPKKFKVQVAWSREAGEIFDEEGFDSLLKKVNSKENSQVYPNLSCEEKSFNTEAEAIAYCEGLSDASGWDSPTYKIVQK